MSHTVKVTLFIRLPLAYNRCIRINLLRNQRFSQGKRLPAFWTRIISYTLAPGESYDGQIGYPLYIVMPVNKTRQAASPPAWSCPMARLVLLVRTGCAGPLIAVMSDRYQSIKSAS